MTRWPDSIENSHWQYGVDKDFMKELRQYWLDVYDWRVTENKINSFENFIVSIDGFDVHFLHIKGKGDNNIPIIITHGWPGSFLEMFKLIPLLTKNVECSFHNCLF